MPLKSTLLETEGPSSDSAILGINLTDSDTNRIGLHESVSMNFRLDYGHLYARNHATSNFSIPSMPQDVSCTPTAVQGQAESTSRDRPQQLKQTGIGAENASSQPSQRPTDEGETPKGQYPCEICGRRYAQLQGVRRHYRAMHDPSSCSYCDFKWSRPYQYRAHIKKRHRDVIPDVALNEAMWARRRAARNARCIRQQPVLALTPDPDRRVGAETWRGPLTTPPSEAVRATPAHSPAISHVDYGPQSESVELVERKLEDASESELRAAFSSTEELAQRVMDLNMSARGWYVLPLSTSCSIVRPLSPGFEMRRSLPTRTVGLLVLVQRAPLPWYPYLSPHPQDHLVNMVTARLSGVIGFSLVDPRIPNPLPCPLQ